MKEHIKARLITKNFTDKGVSIIILWDIDMRVIFWMALDMEKVRNSIDRGPIMWANSITVLLNIKSPNFTV